MAIAEVCTFLFGRDLRFMANGLGYPLHAHCVVHEDFRLAILRR
jgi:hypothetical protein